MSQLDFMWWSASNLPFSAKNNMEVCDTQCHRRLLMWGRILYGIQLKLKWASQCKNSRVRSLRNMCMHTYMISMCRCMYYIYLKQHNGRIKWIKNYQTIWTTKPLYTWVLETNQCILNCVQPCFGWGPTWIISNSWSNRASPQTKDGQKAVSTVP